MNTGVLWPTSVVAGSGNWRSKPSCIGGHLMIRVAVSVTFTNLVHDPATVWVAWDRVRRNSGRPHRWDGR